MVRKYDYDKYDGLFLYVIFNQNGKGESPKKSININIKKKDWLKDKSE